jgi:hypothetical protein
LALVALAACSERFSLTPDAPAGSLVFLFALDAKNQPTRVERLGTPREIELEPVTKVDSSATGLKIEIFGRFWPMYFAGVSIL